jgi:hypothetical protein
MKRSRAKAAESAIPPMVAIIPSAMAAVTARPAPRSPHHTRHKGERPAVAFVRLVIASCRAQNRKTPINATIASLATSNWGVRPP